MEKNVVEIMDVSFSYNGDDKRSLEHVNLQIDEGEVVVLCGESGCGKSTLIRLLNGLIPFYYKGKLEGQVKVFGRQTEEMGLYGLGARVGTVFQNPRSQFFCVDVRSELAFGAENLKYEKTEIENRIERVSRELACEPLLDRTMFQLSGGEKQKIACASVSVTDHPLIVLDEPSSNLDVEAVTELKKMLQYWKQKRKTIVIAEHRLEYLQEVATRFLYMKDGKILSEYTPAELRELSPEEIAGMGLRSLSYAHLWIQNVWDGNFTDESLNSDVRERLDGVRERRTDFVEIRDFFFRYKRRKEPSLAIAKWKLPKSAVIAIVGKNGAGKTTFVRCFCGLEKKAKGVLIDGNAKYKAKQRLDASFLVMQDVNRQLFTESVEEEILLSMEETEENREELLEKILREFDLYEFRKRHPMSLSGGQKQRVAVACAVASSREYIFFDEPTSGLDYFHMKQVADCIRDLQKKGKNIFLITHDIELIDSCCDYVIRMENGSIREMYRMKE